jgi:DNA-binding response OmpR family regulator
VTRGRILVVEDDVALAALVTEELEVAGYEVQRATTGSEGLGEVALHPFDLVLLDLNLPDGDGLEVAERLRDDGVAVLMMTARGDVESRVAGFDAGATDYVPKPFDVRELLARVHARMRERVGGEVLERGDVAYEVETRTVRAAGGSITLPPREAELLQLLMAHPGRVFSRADIEHRLHQGELPASNTIQVHVSQLRRRLAEIGVRTLVRTVRGRGYTVP